MKKCYLLLIVFGIITVSCKNKGCTDELASNYESDAKKDDGSCEYDTIQEVPPINNSTEVIGYSILEKLPGIWNGPVSSPTYLGGYPEWIVDFRPIHPAQISSKNELDSLNDIFMSFFIVRHGGEYKMAFRNGGGFAGDVRTSYMLIDSLDDAGPNFYYRFSDPEGGKDRVYTEVLFKQDSLIMTTYTNQYNTQQSPSLHMKWQADLRDLTSAGDAISAFSFPQKQMVRDFTNSFDGLGEAVFYGNLGDPYPEAEQPYLGLSTVHIDVTNPPTVDTSKNILIIITTQPLFDGFVFQTQNLDFRSRYVFVQALQSTSFDFNYMHPGSYYVNTIYDVNGDFNFSSGDYMNGNFDVSLTTVAEGTSSCALTINQLIP